MKITRTQLTQVIREVLEDRMRPAYEEGSVGSHIEEAMILVKAGKDIADILDSLQAALDTLENDPGYGMIDDRDQLDLYEAHGLSKADAKALKDFAKDQKGDIKRIIDFLVKSNVEVDKTQDVTKMKKKESKK